MLEHVSSLPQHGKQGAAEQKRELVDPRIGAIYNFREFEFHGRRASNSKNGMKMRSEILTRPLFQHANSSRARLQRVGSRDVGLAAKIR
jgi:hypothetical protein